MRDIQEWKKEVEDYNSALKVKLDKDSNFKELYYGFEVIDGKLTNNPDILFIGINPGAGSGEHGKNIFETSHISYLDKYDENYQVDYPNTYHLAEKTIRFFEKAGWSEDKIRKVFSERVVKTNFYHLATSNITDLNTVLRDLEFKDQYFKDSARFTIQLINILKPKVVILEGKTVFDFIIEQCYEKNVWTDKDFGYHFDEPNQSHILGYNRNMSNEDREFFVRKLKEVFEVDHVAITQ